jgi:hypothetical protein
MNFRRTLLKIALFSGLFQISQGMLPAPMCGWCKTPGDTSAYMTGSSSAAMCQSCYAPSVYAGMVQLLTFML